LACFLNVLIALEILENITAYLRKHVVQVELVIVTSIIAVARKIIILDFEKLRNRLIVDSYLSPAISSDYSPYKHLYKTRSTKNAKAIGFAAVGIDNALGHAI